MENLSWGLPTRFDTNGAVQSRLDISDLGSRMIVLSLYRATELRLFSHVQKAGLIKTQLKLRLGYFVIINEPRHKKTNILVSD